MSDKEIMYEFLYCDCIHESAYATISLHRTRIGAEQAMEKHIQQEKKVWRDYANTPERKKERPFGQHEAWTIGEIEVQD